MRKSITLIVAAAALAACGADSDVQEQNKPTPQTADAAAPGAHTGAGGDYIPLSRESVTRWMNAMLASARLVEQNRDVADAVGMDGDETAAEAVAEIKKHPELVSALRREGLTPEQYVGMMQTMLGAMMAQGFMEAGQLTELPAHVRQADVDFIAGNKEWFEREWARVQAAMPSDDGRDDDDYDNEGE